MVSVSLLRSIFNLDGSYTFAQEGDILVFFTVHNVSARRTSPKRRSIESDMMYDYGRHLYRTLSFGFHISFGFADIPFYALVLAPDTPRFLPGSSRGIVM